MKFRYPAAAVVLVSAAVHLQMWFDGVRHQHMIGPAFMLNAIGGVVIAILLVTWRTSWVPLFLCAGFGVATLGAFITASTVGLYGVHTHWEGFRVWAAAISEVLAIVLGLLAARDEGYLSRGQTQHRGAVGTVDLH